MLVHRLLVCKLKDELELIWRHHQQECFERSHVLELGAAWRNHLSKWAPLMPSMIDQRPKGNAAKSLRPISCRG